MPLVKSTLANKSPTLGPAGGPSGRSHAHFAGEYGSTGRPAVSPSASRTASSGKMLRAQQSANKADAAQKKSLAAKTRDDQVAHAREAQRHANNAKRHLEGATAVEHAHEAEKLRTRVEKTRDAATKTVTGATPPPPKTDTSGKLSVSGVVGPFRAQVQAQLDRRPAQQSAAHMATAQQHMANAARHLQNYHSAETSADKSHHAASAVESARAAILSTHDSLKSGLGPMTTRHQAMISQASAISGVAEKHLQSLESPQARVTADRARRAIDAMKSAQSSADMSTGSSKAMHELMAEKHRVKAMKLAKESTQHYEDTGEGHSHQVEMNEMLKSLRKSRKT